MTKIKVGYVVSYDFEMLFISIKQLYDYVDKIVIAIDKDGKTWSGNDFEIPNSFFEKIKTIDVKNKIQLYFDSFYVPNLSPSECDTRERNMLFKAMGKGGWLMQLDVDEYVYDFKKLVKYLNKYWYLTIFPKWTPILFRGKLVTLFKNKSDGYFYIENGERFPFVTNTPNFEACRANKSIRNHFTNFNVIHNSWARTDSEIQMKIKNWGHRDDFDTLKFFEFWQSLDNENYNNYKDFHPLVPEVWNKLLFMTCNSVEDFISKYAENNKQKLIFIKTTIIWNALIKKNPFIR